MTNANQAERRENLRLPSSRPVLMIIDNKNIYATMTDFSRHGIGFISSEMPKIHSRIEIHFDIPSSQENKEVKPFQFKAEIKHCFTYSNESHIGVRIEQPSQEYLKLFDQLTAA
ncbi:PilZ domain-containing protein [Thiomicrorhabdus sp. Milos-T2]|uniref:PilZ domain-containing protein n=1 Tax=Thiomicrorhabdus sp. Milos-T2 TaxID=90814 RepID=UPI0004941231|nr:PilZ domain-containing protein [Thiomicrorhabdus sp. Milos-T2]